MTTIDELFSFYRNRFLPAYADLVALEVAKPTQILIEESNILSHVVQFHNPLLSDELKRENLEKVKSHLIRATIDVNKLLWAHLREELDRYVFDPTKRLVFNASEPDILSQHRDFVEKGRLARRQEVASIGNNPLTAVQKYEDANLTGFNLWKSIDFNKAEQIKKWRYFLTTKEFISGLIIGVIASLIASLIVFLIRE